MTSLKGITNKEEFDKKAKEAITNYSKQVNTAEYLSQIKQSLESSKADLEALKTHNAALKRAAHGRAGMMLGAGFLGCLGQLGMFTVTIYGLYDWNVMEPYTWMFCKIFCLSSPNILFRNFLLDGWKLLLPVDKVRLGVH